MGNRPVIWHLEDAEITAERVADTLGGLGAVVESYDSGHTCAGVWAGARDANTLPAVVIVDLFVPERFKLLARVLFGRPAHLLGKLRNAMLYFPCLAVVSLLAPWFKGKFRKELKDFGGEHKQNKWVFSGLGFLHQRLRLKDVGEVRFYVYSHVANDKYREWSALFRQFSDRALEDLKGVQADWEKEFSSELRVVAKGYFEVHGGIATNRLLHDSFATITSELSEYLGPPSVEG